MRSKNTVRAMLATAAIVAAFMVMLVMPAVGAEKPMGGMGGMMYDASNPPAGLDQVKEFANMASSNLMDKKYMDAMFNLHVATWILEEGLGQHMGMHMDGMMGGGMGMGMGMDGMMGGGMGMGMGNMMGGMDGMMDGCMCNMMGGMGKEEMKEGDKNKKEEMKEAPKKERGNDKDKDDKKMGWGQDKEKSGGMMGMGMPMMMDMAPMYLDQVTALIKEGMSALDAGKYYDACHAFHSAMYVYQAGKMMAMMESMMSGKGMGMMGGMGEMNMPPTTAPAPAPKSGY